jgi:hypothetical protein
MDAATNKADEMVGNGLAMLPSGGEPPLGSTYKMCVSGRIRALTGGKQEEVVGGIEPHCNCKEKLDGQSKLCTMVTLVHVVMPLGIGGTQTLSVS